MCNTCDGLLQSKFLRNCFDSIRFVRPDNSRFAEILQVVASKVGRSNSLLPAFSGPEENPMARRVQHSLRPRRLEVR